MPCLYLWLWYSYEFKGIQKQKPEQNAPESYNYAA